MTDCQFDLSVEICSPAMMFCCILRGPSLNKYGVSIKMLPVLFRFPDKFL